MDFRIIVMLLQMLVTWSKTLVVQSLFDSAIQEMPCKCSYQWISCMGKLLKLSYYVEI